MQESRAPKVVMIGGGTGSFTLLSSLKHYVRDITAVVNMADDGGSSGVLRDELGVLPPGDVRQCLVALSQAPDAMRELFTYRFDDGALSGHSFGNLFLTAVEKMSDDFGEAIAMAAKVLNVQGRVVPVTLDKVHLVMKDGRRVVRGEFKIAHEHFKSSAPPKLSLEPRAKLNPAAQKAIAAADIIVIAPGNLYGSIIPTLIVGGMKKAIKDSKAKLVQVTNLVTKPGQTDGFGVGDYVATIERYVGRGRVDYVLYNNKQPSQEMMRRYAKAGELPVTLAENTLDGSKPKAIGDDFIAHAVYHPITGDPIAAQRTLLRHDADKVSRHIMRIFYS